MAGERLIVAITFSLMSIVALVGNFHIIYTILRLKKMQTVANTFLLSLAIADFIVGAIVMPTTIVTAIADRWLSGSVMCDLSAFTDNVSLTMSMWSLGLLSIERFFLMVYPFRYHSYMTPRSASVLIWMSWVFVCCISVCPMLGWGGYTFTDTYSCGIAVPPTQTPDWYYFPFFCCAAFAPPITVGTFSYTAIIRILVKQRGPKVYLSGGSGRDKFEKLKRTEVEKQEIMNACLSVFICLVLMILFNLPTVIMGMCMISGVKMEIPPAVGLVFHVTWYLKSAVNPLVFGLMNQNFRREIWDYRIVKWVGIKNKSADKGHTVAFTGSVFN